MKLITIAHRVLAIVAGCWRKSSATSYSAELFVWFFRKRCQGHLSIAMIESPNQSNSDNPETCSKLADTWLLMLVLTCESRQILSICYHWRLTSILLEHVQRTDGFLFIFDSFASNGWSDKCCLVFATDLLCTSWKRIPSLYL